MGDRMFDSPEFAAAARKAASNLDFIVSCLGSDLDTIIDQMVGLCEDRKKLARLRREHWKVLKTVLIDALEQAIGTRSSEDEISCWGVCFDAVSNHYIDAINEEKAVNQRRKGM